MLKKKEYSLMYLLCIYFISESKRLREICVKEPRRKTQRQEMWEKELKTQNQ